MYLLRRPPCLIIFALLDLYMLHLLFIILLSFVSLFLVSNYSFSQISRTKVNKSEFLVSGWVIIMLSSHIIMEVNPLALTWGIRKKVVHSLNNAALNVKVIIIDSVIFWAWL